MSKVLFVHAKGGPPLGHALSRVAARSAVHLLALSALPPSVAASAERLCASVLTPADSERHDLVSLIVSRAQAVGADAVVTFSEYAVVAVAEACEKLGLAGAGSSCALARDKRMMRRTWQDSGIPSPGSAPSPREQDLHDAAAALRFPLLLKAAWSAGLHRPPDHPLPAGGPGGLGAVARGDGRIRPAGLRRTPCGRAGADFVVEEIVTGTAAEWFDEPGWGDYVSVEGVVGGRRLPAGLPQRADADRGAVHRTRRHHPGACSRRMPRSASWPSHGRPSTRWACANCGTHTEIKLGADGRMWVIETAARFGGAMTVPQIEEVFGLDLIGMLVDHLLGRPVAWPARARTPQEARGAAGSLVVLAVDGAGEAWPDRRVWDFPAVQDAVPLERGQPAVRGGRELAPGRRDGAGLRPGRRRQHHGGAVPALRRRPADRAPRLPTLVDALPAVLPAAGPRGGAVMTTDLLSAGAPGPRTDRTVVGENLSLPLFRTLSGVLAGHPYLKVVVDRTENTWHLLDTAAHPFHVNYIATRVLGMELADAGRRAWTPSTPRSTWTPSAASCSACSPCTPTRTRTAASAPSSSWRRPRPTPCTARLLGGVLHVRPRAGSTAGCRCC